MSIPTDEFVDTIKWMEDELIDEVGNPEAVIPINEPGRKILYTLNPTWNDMIATVMGAFQGGEIPGSMQFGSAWWFNDQIDGMRAQMASLANMGLLSRFVGMLTDSRSFLSFPRHEYFRRILCSMVGGWMARGEAPEDYGLLGGMIEDICWRNAADRFRIPGVETPQRQTR